VVYGEHFRVARPNRTAGWLGIDRQTSFLPRRQLLWTRLICTSSGPERRPRRIAPEHVDSTRGNHDHGISGTEFSHEHRDAFDKLDDDGKDGFLWKFRHAINTHHADFEIEGANGILDCPTRFKISATRYEDGLTLDSFAQSLGSVLKTQLSAIWVIQEHLTPRSFGSGGRFDFKRLGL
jgi:hypothetical protein